MSITTCSCTDDCPNAIDPETNETFTLAELCAHANTLGEQIEKLQSDPRLAISPMQFIEALDVYLSAPKPAPAPKSPEERLVAVYRELLDFSSDDGEANFRARAAAETLAPVVAPILARKAA